MAGIDVMKVVDTIMSIPGMNEMVKIDLRISRRNVLLLASVLERGLDKNNAELPVLLENVSPEALEELRKFSDECLQKAGLVELKEKLGSFTKK